MTIHTSFIKGTRFRIFHLFGSMTDKSRFFLWMTQARARGYQVILTEEIKPCTIQHSILRITQKWNTALSLHCTTSPIVQVWRALSREEYISMKPSLFVSFSKGLVRCRYRISGTLTTPRMNYCALNPKSGKYGQWSYIKLEQCPSPIRPYHLPRTSAQYLSLTQVCVDSRLGFVPLAAVESWWC